MSEEEQTRKSMDPIELWKQWYETSSGLWSGALSGVKETKTDSSNLSDVWLKGIQEVQERLKIDPARMMDQTEIWKQWFDVTMGAWKKAFEVNGDTSEIATRWLKMMDEMRANLLAGSGTLLDPFTFFKQWYDATNETWATMLNDVAASEKFLEFSSSFFESYLTFVGVTRRAHEAYFRSLQLPVLSDVARVAELIIALEEKVDGIDEVLEDFKDRQAEVATSASVEALTQHLAVVEGKLDVLPDALRLGTLDVLARRLEKVESKLDNLAKLESVEDLSSRLESVESKLTLLSKLDSVENLTTRLDSVETKLHQVLTVLEKIVAGDSLPTVKSGGVQRKAHKKNTNQQEDQNVEVGVGS